MRPFEEAKDEIYGRERQRLMARELPKYLKELEERSFVEAAPPPGAEDFRRAADGTEAPDPLEAFRRPSPTGASEPAPAGLEPPATEAPVPEKPPTEKPPQP
jgi:hypothetical protein